MMRFWHFATDVDKNPNIFLTVFPQLMFENVSFLIQIINMLQKDKMNLQDKLILRHFTKIDI